MSEPSEPDDLAETFAEIARALMSGTPTLQDTLDRIVSSACATVPGCAHAAISLVENRTITTRAASDDVPVRVDAIQYEAGQGPCLDAIREHAAFRADDLATDERWPAFSTRASNETGIRSMLSLRLFKDETTMGALNLYSSEPGALGDEASAAGAVLAAHAAVAMSNARDVEHLREAMVSRAPIEQAKGIIMAATGCTPDEAFNVLREQSQRLNEKLRDIASELVLRQAKRAR